MSGALSAVYSVAPVIMLALAFGVIFGVVRIKSILFFLLFLMLLPFAFSSIVQVFQGGVSGLSWKGWIIVLFVGFVVIRLLIDRGLRR